MNRRERRMQWQVSHGRGANASLAGIHHDQTAVHPDIRMQIGDLVLRGFEKRHASRIATAFERGLDDRLRTGVLPAHLSHRLRTPSLRLMPFTLTRPNDPVAIGEQLAGTVLAFKPNGWRGGPR